MQSCSANWSDRAPDCLISFLLRGKHSLCISKWLGINEQSWSLLCMQLLCLNLLNLSLADSFADMCRFVYIYFFLLSLLIINTFYSYIWLQQINSLYFFNGKNHCRFVYLMHSKLNNPWSIFGFPPDTSVTLSRCNGFVCYFNIENLSFKVVCR